MSIFPGIDILGRGFEEEGFCVVRGPDLFWGGDIRSFHPPAGRFHGVIGGPPCQMFSMMMRIWKNQQASRPPKPCQNLIPEFARCVSEAQPDWYLMENVEAAPEPETPDYGQQIITVDCQLFGVRQKRRIRKFVFGSRSGLRILLTPTWPLPSADECFYTATASEGARGGRRWKNDGCVRKGKYVRRTPWPDFCESQGLPRDFDLPGMKVEGKYKAVGNAVPVQAARAFARAIREAIEGHA